MRCPASKIECTNERFSMIKFIALITASFLTSCVTSYVGPRYDESTTAVVRGSSSRRGAFDWERYTINMVDDKAVIYIVHSKERVVLTAGKHQIVVTSAFNRGGGLFGIGPFEAMTDFIFEAMPGREYIVTGRVDGAKIRVWVADKFSGKRVTEEAILPYRKSTSSGSYPIFIPVSS